MVQPSTWYLVLDRDGKFSGDVARMLECLGSKLIRTAYRSPWQNGVAERWVGSCRRELLDHVIVLSESHINGRQPPEAHVSPHRCLLLPVPSYAAKVRRVRPCQNFRKNHEGHDKKARERAVMLMKAARFLGRRLFDDTVRLNSADHPWVKVPPR